MLGAFAVEWVSYGLVKLPVGGGNNAGRRKDGLCSVCMGVGCVNKGEGTGFSILPVASF